MKKTINGIFKNIINYSKDTFEEIKDKYYEVKDNYTPYYNFLKNKLKNKFKNKFTEDPIEYLKDILYDEHLSEKIIYFIKILFSFTCYLGKQVCKINNICFKLFIKLFVITLVKIKDLIFMDIYVEMDYDCPWWDLSWVPVKLESKFNEYKYRLEKFIKELTYSDLIYFYRKNRFFIKQKIEKIFVFIDRKYVRNIKIEIYNFLIWFKFPEESVSNNNLLLIGSDIITKENLPDVISVEKKEEKEIIPDIISKENLPDVISEEKKEEKEIIPDIISKENLPDVISEEKKEELPITIQQDSIHINKKNLPDIIIEEVEEIKIYDLETLKSILPQDDDSVYYNIIKTIIFRNGKDTEIHPFIKNYYFVRDGDKDPDELDYNNFIKDIDAMFNYYFSRMHECKYYMPREEAMFTNLHGIEKDFKERLNKKRVDKLKVIESSICILIILSIIKKFKPTDNDFYYSLMVQYKNLLKNKTTSMVNNTNNSCNEKEIQIIKEINLKIKNTELGILREFHDYDDPKEKIDFENNECSDLKFKRKQFQNCFYYYNNPNKDILNEVDYPFRENILWIILNKKNYKQKISEKILNNYFPESKFDTFDYNFMLIEFKPIIYKYLTKLRTKDFKKNGPDFKQIYINKNNINKENDLNEERELNDLNYHYDILTYRLEQEEKRKYIKDNTYSQIIISQYLCVFIIESVKSNFTPADNENYCEMMNKYKKLLVKNKNKKRKI